mmetsp:Transcript_17026/g.44012  ORF Transcript_17026/g.44012 Transcript_17026/m.44012 type:complete len:331 (+) Transcript_17026:722-1714(+)
MMSRLPVSSMSRNAAPCALGALMAAPRSACSAAGGSSAPRPSAPPPPPPSPPSEMTTVPGAMRRQLVASKATAPPERRTLRSSSVWASPLLGSCSAPSKSGRPSRSKSPTRTSGGWGSGDEDGAKLPSPSGRRPIDTLATFKLKWARSHRTLEGGGRVMVTATSGGVSVPLVAPHPSRMSHCGPTASMVPSALRSAQASCCTPGGSSIVALGLSDAVVPPPGCRWPAWPPPRAGHTSRAMRTPAPVRVPASERTGTTRSARQSPSTSTAAGEGVWASGREPSRALTRSKVPSPSLSQNTRSPRPRNAWSSAQRSPKRSLAGSALALKTRG